MIIVAKMMLLPKPLLLSPILILGCIKFGIVVTPAVIVLLRDLSGLQNGGGLVPGAEHLIPAKQH